jgi:hypothetical protein
MIEERLTELIDRRIYIWRNKESGKFLTLCQKKVLEERIMGIDLYPYSTVSKTIEETIYRFVTNDSGRKMCKFCGINQVSFISIDSGWATFCCNSCSSKYKAENGITWVNKPGWKHSEKTKARMSENHADFSGDKNPLKIKIASDPAFSDTLSKNKALYWANLDKDRRKELSETFSMAQANSPNRDNTSIHKNHKSGHFLSKKMAKKMFYRSSWELAVCEFLDDETNDVIFFDIEPFTIEYELDNGEKRYTRVDFHVIHADGRQRILEVKPEAFLNEGNVPYKIKGCKKYARENNMDFLVITKKELEILGEVLK